MAQRLGAQVKTGGQLKNVYLPAHINGVIGLLNAQKKS